MKRTILRIIEAVQSRNVEKAVTYAKRLVPEEEWDILEKLITEKLSLNPNPTVMEGEEYKSIWVYGDDRGELERLKGEGWEVYRQENFPEGSKVFLYRWTSQE